MSADPSPALVQLRERAVGALGLLFGARISGMSQNASRPPPYAAYEEFVQGLDLHVRYQYPAALDHYRRAIELDSTFGSPVVWSALAYWTLDDYARCDSMLRIADRLDGKLSAFDALLAANQRGELDGNWGAALAAAQEMTRVTSGSEGYILVGQESAAPESREAGGGGIPSCRSGSRMDQGLGRLLGISRLRLSHHRQPRGSARGRERRDTAGIPLRRSAYPTKPRSWPRSGGPTS